MQGAIAEQRKFSALLARTDVTKQLASPGGFGDTFEESR